MSIVDQNNTRGIEWLPSHHRLSYSQISQFDKCPLSYRFRYVERLPAKPSHHLSFGSTVHEALEYYYAADLHLLPYEERKQRLTSYFLDNWRNEGFEGMSPREVESWKQKGVTALLGFLAREDMAARKPAAVEERFELPFSVGDGRFVLVGRIDRIDLLDGPSPRIRLVDYKTNASVPAEKYVSGDRQLAVYHLACARKATERLSLPDAPITVSFYYVVAGAVRDFSLSEAQVRDTERYIVDAFQRIDRAVSRNEFPANPSNLCPYCEYRDFCPAFNPSGARGTAAASLEELGEEYVSLGSEVAALVRRMRDLESAIVERMEREGLDSLRLGTCTLHRGPDGKLRAERGGTATG